MAWTRELSQHGVFEGRPRSASGLATGLLALGTFLCARDIPICALSKTSVLLLGCFHELPTKHCIINCQCDHEGQQTPSQGPTPRHKVDWAYITSTRIFTDHSLGNGVIITWATFTFLVLFFPGTQFRLGWAEVIYYMHCLPSCTRERVRMSVSHIMYKLYKRE